ncbi:MAG: hypothetical protein KBD00_02845 [Candidatus Peribacteraceae bacterium]|nr:hypothetical protein [Candidatus Peribacteraceae bacterium]
MKTPHCDIAILRPIEAGFDSLYSQNPDPSEKIYAERVDGIIDTVRSLLDITAEELGIQTEVTEYQLHTNAKGEASFLSLKRSRRVSAKDLIVTVDPSATGFSYISNATKAPMTRGLIAFTDSRQLDDMQLLIAANITMVMKLVKGQPSYFGIPRLFPLQVPLNEDDQTKHHKQNIVTIKKALQYPHITPHTSTRERFTTLYVADPDARESQADFRANFIDK